MIKNFNQLYERILRTSFILFFIVGIMPFYHGVAAAAEPPVSFADLAEKLGPTVVNIYTTQVVKSPQGMNQFHDDAEIPEFFKKFFDFKAPPGHSMPQEQRRRSLGSGVIQTADGYILTNNHVVANATEINVRLTNFQEYEAKLIGRDPKTDLALIKINPDKPLPHVTFGDSENLRVGDWVIAIGNPFGFENTVTAGIVSGKGRNVGGGPYENFIQTDASINLGNSGGPLFNMNGEMVGINTAIYSRTGGNIGIGFAIPINMTKNIIKQLKEEGKVVRGWLGVMIQHVTDDLADKFGLDRPKGALVGEVMEGSPADKAGIQPGDVIVEYQGREINRMNLLPMLVAQTEVGTKAEVVVIRNSKRKTLTVDIAKLDEEDVSRRGQMTDEGKELGLSVQELTPEIAESLNLEEKTGVIITNVERNSPAFDAGLRRGDLILEVNKKSISNLNDFSKALGKVKKGDIILMLAKRNGHNRFITIKIK